ncbi:MAG: histone deacetylase, partial [Actinomycetota bacterium]
MTDSDTGLVWYASYGSNCSRERFLTYLRGGRPPGSTRDQIGARDSSDPLGDAPVEFTTAACFAGHSTRWGGAPAFLEHEPAERPGALGRRYLITAAQFADVLAQ